MRRVALTAAAAAMTAIGALATAGPASASTDCEYPLCAEVVNHLPSGSYVKVARNWCGDGSRRSQDQPPCYGSETYSAATDYVAAGNHTPTYEGWSAFRVEPGCRVTFQFWRVVWIDVTGGAHGVWSDVQTSDRRGRGTEWIRVQDNQTAYVQSRTCS